MFLFLALVFLFLSPEGSASNKIKPSIAFSFDDGSSEDILDYQEQVWNAMIVTHLKKFKVQSVWFVCGTDIDNEKGKQLLKQWDNYGNILANHSYHHFSYSDTSITYSYFVKDIQRCDSLIKNFTNYKKIFRFPYLETGNTIVKRDSLSNYFLKNEIKQGWVTIDAFDWYINARLIEQLKINPNFDIKIYRDYYVNHTFEEAKYYNDLSIKLNHRQINHILLLHLNLTSALFLGDLIQKFKKEGWKIKDYGAAIKDQIHKTAYNTLAGGQNLISSMAQKIGAYNDDLRYISQIDVNEKGEIDSLDISKPTPQIIKVKNYLRK